MEFKDKLKQLRIQNGLTQRELAELTGISVPAIEKYESGQREPKRDYLNRLANVLGVNPDELIICTKKFEGFLEIVKRMDEI